MNHLHRATAASRVFCIAAILGLGLFDRDMQVIVSLVVIATVATSAVYVSLATPLAMSVIVTVEAAVTGLVIGLALPGGVVFLPYLVVLSLVAGMSAGVVAVSAVVVAQFVTLSLVTITWPAGVTGADLLRAMSPWLLTSIGAGLLGAWLRGDTKRTRPDGAHASYESAHRLLNQLRIVARRLSSGLDPVTMAVHIRDVVSATLAADHTAVFVQTDGALSPLLYSDETARERLDPANAVVANCWTEMEPIASGENHGDVAAKIVALPLRAGSRMVGVVMTQLEEAPTAPALKAVMQTLDDHSIRLDTALAFDEIRAMATAEERSRLAREIHDGIAQEIASLGYRVDNLLAEAASGHQKSELEALRRELSRVVNELRLSIFDLRSEVLSGNGFGAALSEYVRQVGTRSQMTVHVSLDEAPTRLRSEIEAELLRIAQEAITNARKHSRARNLWVKCKVDPPFAHLEVRDDGVGLHDGREDSYGMRIMAERSERINARLEVTDVRQTTGYPGTLVTLTLGDPPSAAMESEVNRGGGASQERIAHRRP